MTRLPLLKVDDLTIAYRFPGASLVAVDGVNFELEKKELVAVVGESGCGKSTLALSIIGLLPSPPARVLRGSVEYKGTNLLGLNAGQLRRYRGTEIAMIFQEPLTSLNPVYRVGDQIAEAIAIHNGRKARDFAVHDDNGTMHETSHEVHPSKRFRLGRKVSSETNEQIVDALKLVRIADPEQVIERYPFELSGGMSQRVMIAMALSQRPSLLVADEPTTALDLTTQAQVLKLIRDLMDEVDTSILLITHDLAVACQVADRVMVMYAGEIVEESDVAGLFSNPLHPYTQGLISCIPTKSKDESKLSPIPGSVLLRFMSPPGCRFVARCPYAMEICRQKPPPLEEVRRGHKVACFLHAGK